MYVNVPSFDTTQTRSVSADNQLPTDYWKNKDSVSSRLVLCNFQTDRRANKEWISRQEFKVMESRSPPPAHEATYSMLLTATQPPPTYSSCVNSSNRDRSLVECIPSGSGIIQRVIPGPLDFSGSSVVSGAHQPSTIAPGSSTMLTCPSSSPEVGPGCEDLEFRRSESESPPPSYETATITSRLRRPVKFTVRDVASRQGHDPSTVPSTSSPSHVMITSRHVTSRPDRVVSTVSSTPRPDPSINHLPMSGVSRPIADRISRPTPCNNFVEQPGTIPSSVYCCGVKIDLKYNFACYVTFSIVFVVLFIFLVGLIKNLAIFS